MSRKGDNQVLKLSHLPSAKNTGFDLSEIMDQQSRFLLYLGFAAYICCLTCDGQQFGSFNYAKKSSGEREGGTRNDSTFDDTRKNSSLEITAKDLSLNGDLNTIEIAGISIGILAGVGAMAVTIFFCYFVYRQQKQQDIRFSFDAEKY